MATGAVTDLGASDRMMSRGRPTAQPSSTALAQATAPPNRAAHSSRAQRRRSSARRIHKGQASATTAGPSRKWMNWAPPK
ncbi:Uncharacterised protein [Bordetella pertussis]|nr:Uncharacterised protein [Bordetella pertussis]